MKQKIISFETDEENHWRAVLECGHYQHVRHRPPLETREWVLDDSERKTRIGVELDCPRCDIEQEHRRIR